MSRGWGGKLTKKSPEFLRKRDILPIGVISLDICKLFIAPMVSKRPVVGKAAARKQASLYALNLKWGLSAKWRTSRTKGGPCHSERSEESQEGSTGRLLNYTYYGYGAGVQRRGYASILDSSLRSE
jgi:hypothetical protein